VKLIVGLGNPGLRYEKTRHNAGFMAIDRLVARHASGQTPRGRFDAAVVEGRVSPKAVAGWGKPAPAPAAAGAQVADPGHPEPAKVAFIKPNTFMNLSGKSVSQAVHFYKIDPARDLLVITDDVALPLGHIRIKPGGGAGGHNGLTDITRALGTDQYPRCRVGIDAKPPFMDQADWVLSRFTDDEMARLDTTLDRVTDAVETFIRDGLDAAMNQANVDPDAPPRPKRPRPPDKPGPDTPPGGTGPPGAEGTKH
jgi:PTH1 family peptidyl-tRNA hydrolase